MNEGERTLSDWLAHGYAATRTETNGAAPGAPDDAEPPLTDRGFAQRIAREHGDVLRYCPARGGWLSYDGTRYQPDPEPAFIATLPRAKATARRFLEHVLAEPALDRARLNRALYFESAAGLRHALDLARSEPGIPIPLAALDAEPWALNTPSGIVDLTTGALGPHEPGRMMTRITAVGYDPAAPCPKFEGFLARILDGHAARVEHLQRVCGMATTGATEAVLPILTGRGANGKTTLVKILRGVLGPDYAGDTPAETLLVKRRSGGIPSDLARLAGLRLVHAAELEGQLSEAVVKNATGGDAITAREMYSSWFEYVPQFTLLITCNRLPRITGTDEAIWRRVHVIPFDVTIPPAEQVRDFADQLVADEGPGILAWMVRGAIAWRQAGRLIPPDDVLQATRTYRGEQDSLRPFLAECCVVDPTARVTVAELYAVYQTWARDSGEAILSKSELRRALMARGLPEPMRGSKGTRMWCGLRHRTPDEPDLGPAEAAPAELNLW